MSFYKKTGYMGTGLVLSGVGGLFMNIGLGRILSGPEYGLFRVFFSAILIVGWILVFGIERDITAQLSAGNGESEAIGSTFTFVLLLCGLFVFAATFAQSPLLRALGSSAMVLPFIAGTVAFVGYRYSMGVLKGYGLMKEVGVQNIFLGVGKAGVVLVAAVLSWQAFELSLFVAGTFAVVSLLALLWLRHPISAVDVQFPSADLIRRVSLSTSKQVGDVIVKFGGPVIVPLVGGASLEAGIFGGALTLALIPFYGYNAIINNILPEVSELNADGDAEGIGRRVGFLLEVSAVLLVGWVAFGTLVGPALVPRIYQPTFVVSSVGAFSIFFVASAVIVSSLLTEVLIGIKAQRAVGRAWISPLVLLPIVTVGPWSPIVSTGIVLSLYVTAVICLLGYALRVSHIPVSWTGFDYTVFD